jgi:hypothetical protein
VILGRLARFLLQLPQRSTRYITKLILFLSGQLGSNHMGDVTKDMLLRSGNATSNRLADVSSSVLHFQSHKLYDFWANLSLETCSNQQPNQMGRQFCQQSALPLQFEDYVDGQQKTVHLELCPAKFEPSQLAMNTILYAQRKQLLPRMIILFLNIDPKSRIIPRAIMADRRKKRTVLPSPQDKQGQRRCSACPTEKHKKKE